MLHRKGAGRGVQKKNQTHLYLQWTLFSKQPLEFLPIVLCCAQRSIWQVISIFRMSGNALLWFFFFTLWDHSAIYWKSYEEQTLIGYCKVKTKNSYYFGLKTMRLAKSLA